MKDRLSIISGLLVSMIALLAFILSFDAIMKLAIDNGTPEELAWMVPLIVDGSMIVFSVSVMRATLANEKTRIGWALIIAFTAVSVWFNVAHSNLTTFGIAIAALAPLALFATFETLMGQIRSTVQGGVNALAKKWQSRANVLLRLAKEWRSRANNLERLVKEYEAAIERRESELQKEKEQRKAIEAKLKQLSDGAKGINPLAKDIIALVTTGEGTGAAIAEKHGVSEATVSKIKGYLNGAKEAS